MTLSAFLQRFCTDSLDRCNAELRFLVEAVITTVTQFTTPASSAILVKIMTVTDTEIGLLHCITSGEYSDAGLIGVVMSTLYQWSKHPILPTGSGHGAF